MILIDANLLIYAHVNNLPQHFAAKGWLDDCLNASAPVGLPWPSLMGFLRIVTNPRIFEQPESIKDAWKQIKEWLECPSANCHDLDLQGDTVDSDLPEFISKN